MCPSSDLSLDLLTCYVSLQPYAPASATATAFRPLAATSLAVSSSVPARVLQLARARGLQRQFGDFDDHLEDVRIDWLRNAAVEEVLQAQ